MEQTLDISSWITRVRKAEKSAQVLAILEEFRPLSWSDEQRALMAKTYVPLLDELAANEPQEVKEQVEEVKEDGPVWYEKM